MEKVELAYRVVPRKNFRAFDEFLSADPDNYDRAFFAIRNEERRSIFNRS